MYRRVRSLQTLNRLLRPDLQRLKECRNCARALATSSSSTNKLDERVGAVQRVVLAAQRAQEADPRVGYAGLVAAEAEREEAVDEGDVFGTLEPDLNQKVASSFIFEEDDNDAQDELEEKTGDIYRPGSEDYLRRMNELIHKKRDLVGALDILETEMKQEYVRPKQPHFRLLINACAKVGHAAKAFQLYREFKERNLPSHIGIYSDLFHSCTKSDDRLLGLEKATGLMNELREKHINPNRVVYHSMIQAFGRCGDLKTAFNLVDEMKEQKFSIDSDVFNFIIQGCISDKENGFRHALIVWRNMRRKKIIPKIYTYNLMLRCANECGLGSMEHVQDILLESVSKVEREKMIRRIEAGKNRLAVESGAGQQKQQAGVALAEQKWSADTPVPEQKWSADTPVSEQKWSADTPVPEQKWWEIDVSLYTNQAKHVQPDISLSLLDVHPRLDNVLSLDLEDTPQNRLMLLGGPKHVVKVMKSDHVNPDLKTISILLQNNKSLEMEEEIFDLLPALGLKLDTAFYNQLIQQRGRRGDYKEGIKVLELMTRTQVSPDILTFGLLATCCNNRQTGLNLLTDLRDYGVQPNKEIMGGLIKRATDRFSPGDVKLFLSIMQREGIATDRNLLQTIEGFQRTFKKHIQTKESAEGGYVPFGVILDMRQDYKHWREFTAFYKEWLLSIKLEKETNKLDQYQTAKERKGLEEEKEERRREREEKRRAQEERRRVFEEKNEERSINGHHSDRREGFKERRGPKHEAWRGEFQGDHSNRRMEFDERRGHPQEGWRGEFQGDHSNRRMEFNERRGSQQKGWKGEFINKKIKDHKLKKGYNAKKI